MKAGRKLDVLIAEKVMRWKVTHFQELGIYQAYDEDEGSININLNFSPSTNIADAWRVVEKLKEKFWVKVTAERKNLYLCDVGEYGLVSSFEQAAAETASLAICLAVLKAVGVDLEEKQ